MTPADLRAIWWRFLAWSRLSHAAVCRMSVNGRDYHDYPDSGDGPMHFHVHKCRRCGKEFEI